ncbi:MAG: hypothetical protein WC058_03350 [Phycisphaeraceae bacterium]
MSDTTNATNAVNTATVTTLRQLVQRQVDIRWDDFAREHPHLAAAVDRSVLIDSAVRRLADDPAYRAAMDQAAKDEATMAVGAKVVERVETWVTRLLGL